MTPKRLRSIIAASILTQLLACLIGSVMGPGADAAPHVISIYPVGDSITAGYGPPTQGGYRVPLYQQFKAAGFQVQFIGTSTLNSNDPTLVAASQTHHEGHGGYRIDQIFTNLDGNDNGDSSFGGYWMTGGHGTGRSALTPDIILVHVGTNDILQKNPVDVVEKRFDDLLNGLLSHSPQSKIFIAKILPIGRDYAIDEVKVLNSWVSEKISQNPAYKKSLFLVDMYTPFVDPAEHPMHSPDGIHPDQTGYGIMADTWFKAMSDAGVLTH